VAAVALVGSFSTAAAAQAGHGPARAVPALTVTTVANPRPQLISGSETLIRFTLPPGADRAAAHITGNGRDITPQFAAQPDGSLLGLATGLRHGTDVVTATDGRLHATAGITDHPVTGPVFSGPQQEPFFCETPSGSRRPASRTARRRDPSPLHQDTSWNGKLVYTFAGGCNAGYHQGNETGGVLDDLMLSRGYAVASSTLNVGDQNCDVPLSAEAAMMVKEHFGSCNMLILGTDDAIPASAEWN
jgi:hypothetical protein